MLEKNGHYKSLSIDDELQKIHNKLYQITEPLGWTWGAIQQHMVKQDDEEEDSGPDPELIVKYINDSIVLLGQVINKVAYERRLSILAALNDIKSAKHKECQTKNQGNQENFNKL